MEKVGYLFSSDSIEGLTEYGKRTLIFPCVSFGVNEADKKVYLEVASDKEKRHLDLHKVFGFCKPFDMATEQTFKITGYKKMSKDSKIVYEINIS